jgi:hypothetical protein
MIKIDFEKTSDDGLMVYRDAIYLEDDHALTDADIEAIKQQRFDRWYALITNPPEPVVEDVQSDVIPAVLEPVVEDIPVQE